MKAFIIMLGIEWLMFMWGFFARGGIEDYEAFFGFFTFIGLSFLVMNIFNTTFPSIAINSGGHKSSISGLKKEDLKSEIDKDDKNKPIVLLNKTNLNYFLFFMMNAVIYLVIYLVKYQFVVTSYI